MPVNQTLLNFIAQKHANSRENVAVDALGYILRNSPAAREALTDLLRKANVAVAPISIAITQATGEGGERPDLACYDQQGKECLLIEAKFWAALTDRQPNAYLERLPRDAPSALLFVAPAARLYSLWADLKQRLANEDILLTEQDLGGHQISAAIRTRNQHLMVVDWATLLDRMAQRARSAGDAAANDIDQLRGLAAREDEETAFLPLRPEEMNPEIPRRIRSWKRVVDGVVREMTESGWIRADNKRPSIDDTLEFYGLMLDFAGTRAWFGVDHEQWSTRRNTPLWLELYSSDVLPDNEESRQRLRAIEDRYPGEGSDEENWFVPIFVPTGEEHAAVQKHIVGRLEFICRLIDPESPTYQRRGRRRHN